MPRRNTLAAAACLAAAAFYWFFCVDTLAFSQLVPRPENIYLSTMLKLADFDTGLTRFDVWRLSRMGNRWQERIRALDAMTDKTRRSAEEARLLAEMAEDPVLKKLIKSTFLSGLDIARAVFNAAK